MGIITREQYIAIRNIANAEDTSASKDWPEQKAALDYLRELLKDENPQYLNSIGPKLTCFFRIRPIEANQEKSPVDQIYTQVKQWGVIDNKPHETLLAGFITALFASTSSGSEMGHALHSVMPTDIYKRFVDEDKAGIQELCQRVPTFQWDQCSILGETRLHYAAREGDSWLVNLLLASGADVNAAMPISGSTPLIYALENEQSFSDHHLVTRALLAADNIDLEKRTWPGKNTAIEIAISKLRSSEQTFTLRHGLNWVLLALHSKDLNKEPFTDKIAKVLRWAVNHNDTDAVKQIVASSDLAPSIFNAYMNEPTPLESAVFQNKEMFLCLFNYKHIDLTPKTQEKNILLTAVRGNKTEIVCEILKTEQGKKLVDSAIFEDPFEHRSIPALEIALAEFKNKDIALLLLKHSSAGINARDKNGNTPLHLAAEYGFLQVVEKLLVHNADVNAKNNEGKNPLSLLESRMQNKTMDNDAAIVKMLSQSMMQNSISSQDSGATPYYVAQILSKKQQISGEQSQHITGNTHHFN